MLAVFGILLLPMVAFASANYVSTFAATASSLISTPRGIKVINTGEVYVLGTSTARLASFSADGTSATTITYGTSLPGTPISFVATGSTVYVTTSGTRVVKHAVSGAGTTQSATATLPTSSSTTDIAFQPNGNLFVTKNTTLYFMNTDLQVTATGSLAAAANRIGADNAGNLYYLNSSAGTIRKVTFSGSTIASDTVIVTFGVSISSHKALYVSPGGDMYFADATGTPYISKYSSSGTLQWTYVSQSGDGILSSLSSMTVDANGTIYVVNSSRQVKTYSQVGTVTGLATSVAGNAVTLTWTNPVDSDFSSVTIRRSTSATSYAGISSGTLVTSNVTGTSFTDTGLAEGFYTYSVFSRNTSGRYSGGAHATALVSSTSLVAVRSPLMYWALNETGATLATDASGNGYNGSLYTAAPHLSADIPADIGITNSHSFNFVRTGSQALTVTRPVQDDFTLCAWFKTTSVGAANQHYQTMPLFDSEVGGIGSDFGFGVGSSGTLLFGNGNVTLGADPKIQGTTRVDTGSWTHTCATRRRLTGELAIYLNGALEASGSGSTAALSAKSTMTVGGGTDGGVYWNGNIDEVRVYNSVLSSTAIAALANGTFMTDPVSSGSSSSSSSVATESTSEEPHQSNGGSRRGGVPRADASSLRRVVTPSPKSVSAAPAVREPPKNPVKPVAVAETPKLPEGATVKVSFPLQVRTCRRVEKQFVGNAKMKELMNTRLQKLLGFGCG
ncbi:MAG: LamG domain protein jellyroll fold domain protein [Candidatus Peribacteria bacterium]|nr:LamG domain protein jellyroll fold domain protein [Candidatus Peribacteria bacterium]